MSKTPGPSTIDAASYTDNKSTVNNNGKTENEGNDSCHNTIDTIADNEVFLNVKSVINQKDNNSDIADYHESLGLQNEMHNSELSPIHTETMLRMHHAHNEMLNHYNHIVVGCIKEIFQGVDTNNLSTVLQALKELNFILANRAPKLSDHYGFPLEPHLISTEEIPDFISAYLSRPATNPLEHYSRGRPRTRGNYLNYQYQPSRQSSPVPRHNYNDRTRQTHRSDAYPHFNRLCHEESLLINLDIVTGTGITHIHYQNTNISITKLAITTIIIVTSNVMHPIHLL